MSVKYEVLADLFEEYEDERVDVYYSGGADSLCLLLGLLWAGAKVNLIMFTNAYIMPQPLDYRIARKQITLLKEKYWFTVDEIEVPNIVFRKQYQNCKWALHQFNTFRCMAPLTTSKDSDYIMLGLIMGDQAVSYLPLWKEQWELEKQFMDLGRRLPEIRTPLIRTDKVGVHHITETLLEKMGLTTDIGHLKSSCVAPDSLWMGVGCGQCRSCLSTGIGHKHRISLLKTYRLFSSMDEYISLLTGVVLGDNQSFSMDFDDNMVTITLIDHTEQTTKLLRTYIEDGRLTTDHIEPKRPSALLDSMVPRILRTPAQFIHIFEKAHTYHIK